MGRRTYAFRKPGDQNGGQALILVALVLPLLMSVAAVVVDGANLMAHRRSIQNAADAAALAVAQNIDVSTGTCDSTCLGYADDYARKNGWSGPTLQQCAGSVTTNCFAWPYNGNAQLVKVRLSMTVEGLFTNAVGIGKTFSVSASAAAAANPEINTTTIPGTTSLGYTDPNQTIPGQTHTTTDPDIVIGGNGVGFAMSRICGDAQNPGAIDYSGAGAGTDPADGNKPWVLGAFATNGGLTMSGNAPKKVTSLYFALSGRGGGASACPSPITNVPAGTCTAKKWGDSGDSNNLCVKTLVDLNQNNTLPVTWPFPPPNPLPTPEAGPWNAATDYPSKCVDLGSSGTISITGNGWASTHSPGVYCVRGTATLQFGGGQSGADVSGGDGYTFFALDNATIQTAGNTTIAKYYWPSACDANRPDTWADPRPASYVCNAWGRTLWTNHTYDPQTLLYSNSQASDRNNCTHNAICLNGQAGNMNGDIFAPQPTSFPPTLTQTGATVFVAGGGLSAGRGFIESWQLTIQGNTGNYQGTGTPVVIPGATHTTTDPSTVITGQTHPGTTVDGTTQTTITGTTIGLDE